MNSRVEGRDDWKSDLKFFLWWSSFILAVLKFIMPKVPEPLNHLFEMARLYVPEFLLFYMLGAVPAFVIGVTGLVFYQLSHTVTEPSHDTGFAITLLVANVTGFVSALWFARPVDYGPLTWQSMLPLVMAFSFIAGPFIWLGKSWLFDD